MIEKVNKNIAIMFSRISKRYNLANDLLSLGSHRIWKKKALKILKARKEEKWLDLCCGTGDFLLQSGFGIGADLSYEMLLEAQKRLTSFIPLICADGENLPFKNNSIDKIIIGFGIRNIPQFEKALSEMNRILKKDGRWVVLEFSKPTLPIFSKLYFFYLNKILPIIGGWISGDKEAYDYLARTIHHFPDGNEFLSFIKKAGFKNPQCKKLFLGIASIYWGGGRVMDQAARCKDCLA
ncbi:MAG: ubiquinone/menaquinone biosynthesis methyltransferase [Chlamydiae bacterium]|nr:ubiquinone/menaquinone biosynthesis methyltransferase [Chlamydiota bacterium]MBI3266762.1 ubiquinone/menaquinone biosynthesis methyltransferase [Chlamydiota bacterium]